MQCVLVLQEQLCFLVTKKCIDDNAAEMLDPWQFRVPLEKLLLPHMGIQDQQWVMMGDPTCKG